MVKVLIGNMFDSKAQTLVNTVNCVGVMGKGIALQFKKRFPEMYEDYANLCKAGQVRLGEPYLFKSLIPPMILNFPTKNHWRAVTRLADIINGLEYLEKHYKQWGITSLAVPPLGCGQGQLEWRVVGPTLYKYLKRLEIEIDLYAPFNTPDSDLEVSFLDQQTSKSLQNQKKIHPSKILPGWVALIEILSRIQNHPYHWPVGRTSFQKIAYFATELGISTGLEYKKGDYGPYAPGLKKIISKLVNNGLIFEEKLGRMLAIKIGPTYPNAQTAFKNELLNWSDIINEIVDLFLRMRTKDAELAATIHYASKYFKLSIKNKPSEVDVLKSVLDWKPSLNELDVANAVRNLAALEWLDVQPSDDLPVDDFYACEALVSQ
jgi:uncharacterized protein YwgA/O-acetyl-ADP-ribose deacetylase (regulator of RNase III)